MIPIRDTAPCYSRPYVTWALIAINLAVFAVMLLMPEALKRNFIYLYGMVAARYGHPEWALQMGFSNDYYFSLLSNMFLHSDWVHILMNVWFLWIFADNVEDRMGRGRFIGFYLLCGFIATLCQLFYNTQQVIPVVGASGAIAGVMGAYFFLYPYARIVLWLPIFFLPIFFEVPAIAFLGVWVIMQMHTATIATVTQTLVGVAWFEHLGGFLAGVALYRFFIRNKATNLLK